MMNRTIRFDDSKYATVTSTAALLEEKIKKVSEETGDKIHEAIVAYDTQFKPLKVVVGAHPKKQHKNKFIQWILLKFFGYELEYKTIMTKVVDICQWCFEEPPIEGKCVCQSCLDWAMHEQEEAEDFDLDTFLEEDEQEEAK